MDAIIFDVDGTLWDSRAQVGRAWRIACRRDTGRDRRFTFTQLSRQFGRTMDDIAVWLFPWYGPADRLRLAEAAFAYENEYLAAHPGRLFPGVRETLPKLAARWPLYIVSNCQNGYIETMLAATGLGAYFKAWLCYGDTGTPKGETIRTLMAAQGLTAPCYVGDTLGDEEACRAAGVSFIYAAYGFGSARAPARTITAFPQLADLLKEETL